jgi:hypothetical protein
MLSSLPVAASRYAAIVPAADAAIVPAADAATVPAGLTALLLT